MIIHLPIFNKKGLAFAAITLCFVIIVWVKNPSKKLIAHEKVHVRQWKEDPFFFYLKYVLQWIVNLTLGMSMYEAYRAISYEVDAREIAERFADLRVGQTE